MKIISVQTAEVLGIYTPKLTRTDKKSDKKTYPKMSSLKSIDDLADAAFRQMAGQMVNYFSPHFKTQAMSLDKIKAKQFKKEAKEAHDLLKRGDLNNGFKMYKAMYDEDSYNPRLAYNVGTVYEVAGEFEKAAEYYLGAIANGDITAYARLGYLYERGLGVRHDIVRAAELYSLAVTQDNHHGYSRLGLLYLVGKGVEKKEFQIGEILVRKSVL